MDLFKRSHKRYSKDIVVYKFRSFKSYLATNQIDNRRCAYCPYAVHVSSEGYLDVGDVWNEMGYWLFNIYADAEPVIESDRKGDPTSDRKGDPASMTNCSWLIEQMRPLEVKNDNGTDLNLKPDDLYDFYNSELAAKPGELATRRQPR
jgi:hypothetical protein